MPDKLTRSAGEYCQRIHPPITWLLAATAFAGVLVIYDWFGGALYGRLLIIAAAASMIAAIIHWARRAKPPAVLPPPSEPAEATDWPGRETPAAELGLAIEHIQSIKILLQVSASHNQPVPRAVLVNLDLVLKNLKKLNTAYTSSDENPMHPDLVRHASNTRD